MDDLERYDLLKKEVDSIQIQLSQEHGPWYKTPSNLISVVALLFSFGTTAVSAVNAHKEDVRANHREALALIQRISKLPIDNFELMQKHNGSGPGEALSGMINQENVLLATQAADLIKRFPDSFSATEYFAVANALATSNIINRVPSLFERAIAKAETSNDYNAATRAYGGYLYSKGEYAEGKKHFEMALAVWEKFPEANVFFREATDLMTLMYWSQAELFAQNVREAETHLRHANEKLARLSPGPMTESLRRQLDFTANMILLAPGPPHPLGTESGRPRN